MFHVKQLGLAVPPTPLPVQAGFDCSVLGSGVNPRRGASPTLAVTRRRYDGPQALYNKGDAKCVISEFYYLEYIYLLFFQYFI